MQEFKFEWVSARSDAEASKKVTYFLRDLKTKKKIQKPRFASLSWGKPVSTGLSKRKSPLQRTSFFYKLSKQKQQVWIVYSTRRKKYVWRTQTRKQVALHWASRVYHHLCGYSNGKDIYWALFEWQSSSSSDYSTAVSLSNKQGLKVGPKYVGFCSWLIHTIELLTQGVFKGQAKKAWK